MRGKKAQSFVTVLSIIGAVLIALGVAWLIAQNWHTMTAFMKITILSFFTLAAFTAAFVLEKRDFPKVSHSLYVLGNLLFILSVFQIAQIFHYGTDMQSNAWLFLICMLGVAFTSYYFKSYISMVISFVLFLIWINLQYFSFFANTRMDSPLVIYVSLMLAAGTLFYSANLLHYKIEHPFQGLYQFWSVFYFLLFAYLLTFQTFIPLYWQGDFVINNAFKFSIAVFIIAIASLAVTAYQTVKIGKTRKIEILGLIITVVALLLLIGLTRISQSEIGGCEVMSCYQINLKEECNNQSTLYCEWKGDDWSVGYCSEKGCYDYNNAQQCESQPGCQWDAYDARASPEKFFQCELNCSLIQEKQLCERYELNNYCTWTNEKCVSPEYKPGVDTAKSLYETCAAKDKQQCNAEARCYWNKNADLISYRNKSTPAIEFVWITINLAFIAFLIVVILYGTLIGKEWIVNLGIIFFTVNVITRYIGFIMDLKWYDNLAILFISGGIVLIIGGLLIEKWRRQLISKIKNESQLKPQEEAQSDQKSMRKAKADKGKGKK